MIRTERPRPYVGVSGVATMEQHGELFDIACREGLMGGRHFVMVGVQATDKSQLQCIENSRGRLWHPVGDEIRDAAANEDSGLTKPFLHCYFEDPNDIDPGLEIILGRTIHYAQGVQLNVLPFMSEDYQPFLEQFKERHPDLDVVLQVHKDVLRSYSPRDILRRIGSLPVDYVLLDASSGAGVEMDVDATRPLVDAFYQSSRPVGVVVAGGFEAENVERLFGPLVAEYPDLSCDAEGRLRMGEKGKTELDMSKVLEYIQAWKAVVPEREAA